MVTGSSRAFEKLDAGSRGYLSFPEFQSIPNLCNFLLEEEENHHIIPKFDLLFACHIQYYMLLCIGVAEALCLKQSWI